jgi:hypothetical protein
MNAGAVGYAYAITRKEVTTRDYFNFVQAYLQTHPLQNRLDSRITGTYIVPSGSGVSYDPLFEHYAIDPSWYVAARFCNWQHNGRVNEAWAFDSGAYDTTTFTVTVLPDGGLRFNAQAARSPGARFWIPNEDEMVKAFYYDPHRYGPGLEGYWPWVNAGLDPPILGAPESGGTTNIGQPFGSPLLGAGSYPNATSPWGLLDTSGGLSEWCEDTSFYGSRLEIGSHFAHDAKYIFLDRVDGWERYLAPVGKLGFRVATNIPAPGMSVYYLLMFMAINGR